MSKLEDLLKVTKKTKVAQKGTGQVIIQKRAERKKESEDILKMIKNYDKMESLKRKFLKDLVKDKKLIKNDLFESRIVKLSKEIPDDDDFIEIVRVIYNYDGDLDRARKAVIFINDRLSKLDYIDTSSNLEILQIIEKRPNLSNKVDDIKKIHEREKKIIQNLSRQFSSDFEKKRAELVEGKLKDAYDIVNVKMESVPLTQSETEDLKRNELFRLDILNYIQDDLFGEEDIYEYIISSIDKLDESKDNNNLLFSGIIKIIPTVTPSKNISESVKMYKDVFSKILSHYNQERDTIVSSLLTISEDEILSKRYNVAQIDRFNLEEEDLKDVKDVKQESERKTLKNLYGDLDTLISFKKIEKISNLDGFKLVSKDVLVKPKVEEKPLKKVYQDVVIDDITYKPLIRDKDSKIKKDYKDVKYKEQVSIKPKTPEEIQKEQLELYDKLDKYFPLYNKNTLFSELSDKDLIILRETIITLLSNFFDRDSSKIIETNIYEENKYSVISDYIKKIGNIVIFVDEKYMKNFAKLFNDRLSNNYFDSNSISNLSLKEILYDIYNNPINKESTIQKLNDLVVNQLKLFELNTMQKLAISHASLSSESLTEYTLFKNDLNSLSKNVNPYILDGREKLKSFKSEKDKNIFMSKYYDDAPVILKQYYKNKAEKDILLRQKEEKYSRAKEFDFKERSGLTSILLDEIEPLDVHSCNVEYKGVEQYNKYKTVKREYELKKNSKTLTSDDIDKLNKAKMELVPFLKDIIYYKDDENKEVYCFNLHNLFEQIDNNDFVNPYNNKRLSDDFIDYIRKYRKPDVKKEEDISLLKNLLFDNLNSLDGNLKDNRVISKQEKCDYYSKYIFQKTSLEEKLNKSDEQIKKFRDFCTSVSSIPQVSKNEEESKSSADQSNLPKKKNTKNTKKKGAFGFNPVNVNSSPKKMKINIDMLLKDKSSNISDDNISFSSSSSQLESQSYSMSSSQSHSESKQSKVLPNL